MSNRKRNYHNIGGGLSYSGEWRERRCDGTRHFDCYKSPKRAYYVGKCDCKQFMDAMFALFGIPSDGKKGVSP